MSMHNRHYFLDSTKICTPATNKIFKSRYISRFFTSLLQKLSLNLPNLQTFLPMTIFSNNFFNSLCSLCTNKMCVILQCFLAIPKKHFIVKIIQKTHIQPISVAITIIKKTRNLIYLRKIMYWFSCTKKNDVALIKEDAAGISKPRNLLNQKLEGFKHLH